MPTVASAQQAAPPPAQGHMCQGKAACDRLPAHASRSALTARSARSRRAAVTGEWPSCIERRVAQLPHGCHCRCLRLDFIKVVVCRARGGKGEGGGVEHG